MSQRMSGGEDGKTNGDNGGEGGGEGGGEPKSDGEIVPRLGSVSFDEAKDEGGEEEIGEVGDEQEKAVYSEESEAAGEGERMDLRSR